MLQTLHIENIAVIQNAELCLQDGLTVLSGETGAGKSIILDALGAVLGQRTGRDLVRTGAAKGLVSAVFAALPQALCDKLAELDLASEDDCLYLQRSIGADGKSTCRVNFKPASVSVLKQLAPFLVDILGQNDGQKLLDDSHHIGYLDSFAANEAQLLAYRQKYRQLLSLKREITALEQDEQQRQQQLEELSAANEELTAAALQAGEQAQLLEKKQLFDKAGQLAEGLSRALSVLSGGEQQGGACTALSEVSTALSALSAIGQQYQSLFEQAEEVRCLGEELQTALSNALSQLSFSPAERELCEQRLDELYRLRQKYGKDEHELIDYAEGLLAQIELLQTADDRREALRAEYRTELALAKEMAQALSQTRHQAAERLQKALLRELNELDMPHAVIEISVAEQAKLSQNGMDQVLFLISVNPGEPPKPLSAVASGGELSRIMLALKNVLSAGEDAGTLVFDEVDTGVSGHAAGQIAKKLRSIGKNKQTLCVSHLPQIAAAGRQHLLIEKCVRGAQSFTEVRELDEPQRVDEVARLLSGEAISEAARENARALLREAGL